MVETLNHYKILGNLGKGAMGEVYMALDTKLGRRVALKLLPGRVANDVNWLARFQREARAVAALSHPNIVTLYSIEQAEGRHYFTMELVEGKTLEKTIPDRGFPPERFYELGEALADALAAAHGKGVTHRDLKPANIMIASDGRAKILDFGLAKLVLDEDETGLDSDAPTDLKTQAGTVMGTAAYMSPEQVRAHGVDHRSDIFSLGIILWRMATGHHPFPGESRAERMATILRDPPKLKGEMSEGLHQIVSRCLEKNPDKRYQSALELRDSLREHYRQPASSSMVTELRVAAPAAPENSIAVVPFRDLSAEGDQEYFCDGIAEDLMFALGKVPELRVAARSSTFRFKNHSVDVRDIGQTLGVSSVLEGSVRKAGDQLRVTVQLIEAATGYEVWSDRFDRSWESIFEIQDDIAQRVVESLQVKLGIDFGSRLVRPQTANLEAYNLYLRARHEANRRTADCLEKSIELFEKALGMDSTYARAHAGAADSYALLGIYGARPAEDVMPRARWAATKALQLDSSLAEAHTSLGCVQSVYDWDWKSGWHSFQKAIQLAPDYPLAHQWLAMNNLVPTGRHEEALASLYAAKRLDPLSPVIAVSIGLALYFARHYEAAVKEVEEALRLEEGFSPARFFLGRIYTELGRHDDAVAELEAAIDTAGASSEMLAALGYAHAVAGQPAEADRVLELLTKLSKAHHVSPSVVAQIHAGAGRHDQALEGLLQAANQHSSDLAWVAVRPTFDALHDREEFRRVLERLNLPATSSP